MRARRIVWFSRAAYYRTPLPSLHADAEVIAAQRAIIEKHPRHGFWNRYRCMRRKSQG